MYTALRSVWVTWDVLLFVLFTLGQKERPTRVFFCLFFPAAFFSPLYFFSPAFFLLLFSAFSLMATHSSAYIRSGVEKRERGGTEGEKEKKRKSIAYAAKT